MEKQNYNLIIEYRKKHHRCRYCIFYKYIYAPVGMGCFKCVLKDKPLIDWDYML